MNEAPPDAAARREELRQRFLIHCGGALDLMFHPEYQDQLVTFDQREERAVDLGRDLITWLLQQHVNADATTGRRRIIPTASTSSWTGLRIQPSVQRDPHLSAN